MRAWNKLSASFVRSVRGEGRYSDGWDLDLQLANGGKSWVFQTNVMAASARWASEALGSTRSRWHES